MYKNGNFAVRAATWVATIGAIGLLSTPRLAVADTAPGVTDTAEKCGTNIALKQVTGIPNNPTNLGMHMFVPSEVANGHVTNPGVLVAAHGCDGNGPQFCAATEFAKLAEQYGFIVIYPTANTGTGGAHCFEVSGAALTRSGASDPTGVVSMVDYVLGQYRTGAAATDKSRVFATGWSSGAMLTNVLLADYPDVFAAGAPFAGVPVSCMNPYPDSGRGNACSYGQVTKTAQDWGDVVRAAYDITPAFAGTRPRVQVWHGTSDSILNFANFGEELKQWSNVLGVSTTPVSLDYLGFPTYPATRTSYGPDGTHVLLETVSVSGADHSLLSTPGLAAVAIHFFGLDDNAGAQPAITPDTQPPSAPSNVQASNVTSTGLTLTWTASTDDIGATSYVVLQKLDSTSGVVSAAKAVAGTSASVSGLTAGTAYQFWVQAQDAAGNVSNLSTIVHVTTAAAPGGGGGGGGGGNTGGGGGGTAGGGGGGSGGSSGGGCSHGAASDLALLAMGAFALLRGRRRPSIGA